VIRLPAWLSFGAGCATLVLASFLHPGLTGQGSGQARDGEPGMDSDAGLRATAHLLGGFRPLAIDVLWIRADALFRQGRLWELAALFRGIVALDPGNAAVREFAAWHLSYNVALAEPGPDRRFEWFLRGMEILGAPPEGKPRDNATRVLGARMMVDRFGSGVFPGFAERVAALYGAPPLETAAGWLEEAADDPGTSAVAHAYLLLCTGRLELEAEEAGDPRRARLWGEWKSRALSRAEAKFPQEDWTAWR
jgi:hypothetical protein